IMCDIGTKPAIGFRLSCMLLTEPLDVPDVMPAHVADATGPLRVSFPSMFGSATTGSPVVAALGFDSAQMAIDVPVTSSVNITPTTPRGWPGFGTICPAMTIDAIGSTTIAATDRRLVHGVGFSNGCAEFGPKKPPPFVPACLIATRAATGPRQIVCASILAAT